MEREMIEAGHPLGRRTANFLHTYDPKCTYFGFTFNAPLGRTSRTLHQFNDLLTVVKMHVYKQVVRNSMPINSEWHYIHESMNGKLHIHGIMYIKYDVIIEGVLSDTNTKAKREFKKQYFKTAKYPFNIFNNKYGISLKTPHLDMEYIDSEKGYNTYLAYMHKTLRPHKCVLCGYQDPEDKDIPEYNMCKTPTNTPNN